MKPEGVLDKNALLYIMWLILNLNFRSMKNMTIIFIVCFSTFAHARKMPKNDPITQKYMAEQITSLQEKGIDTIFALSKMISYSNCYGCNKLFIIYKDKEGWVLLRFITLKSGVKPVRQIMEEDVVLCDYYVNNSIALNAEMNKTMSAYHDTLRRTDSTIVISGEMDHGQGYGIYIQVGAQKTETFICCGYSVNGKIKERTPRIWEYVSIFSNNIVFK